MSRIVGRTVESGKAVLAPENYIACDPLIVSTGQEWIKDGIVITLSVRSSLQILASSD